MKKQFLLVASVIALLCTANAQIKKYNLEDLKKIERLRQDMAADKNDSWVPLSMKEFKVFSKMHAADSTDKTRTQNANIGYYGNATLIKLNAVKEIELAVNGITTQNADRYLYHVVINDSIELVHWIKPSVFRYNKFIQYSYLGKFDCLGKIVKVEIYEINNYKNKSTFIFNGGYMPAPKINFVSLNSIISTFSIPINKNISLIVSSAISGLTKL